MEEKNKKTRENCDFKKSQSSKLFLVFGYACAKAASYLARLYIKAATCWTTCIPPILLNRGYIYFSGPYIPSFVSFKNCSRRHLSGKFVFSTTPILASVHPVRLWNFPTGKKSRANYNDKILFGNFSFSI